MEPIDFIVFIFNFVALLAVAFTTTAPPIVIAVFIVVIAVDITFYWAYYKYWNKK